MSYYQMFTMPLHFCSSFLYIDVLFPEDPYDGTPIKYTRNKDYYSIIVYVIVYHLTGPWRSSFRKTFIPYTAVFFLIQLYLLFSFLRHVCFGYAYQNYNFEPKYAYTRLAYKKMSACYARLINFREGFFLRSQENEEFFGKFYIIIFMNPLV